MHALPTLAEIPAATAATEGRDHEALMRLALIPADDRDIRAVAIRQFNADEATNHATTQAPFTEYREMLLDLSNHPAHTPGGLAWKLAMVLNYFSADEDWEWWRYLLSSAVTDAIELERVRALARAAGGDMAEQLGRRWHALIAEHNATPEENDDKRSQLCGDWCAVERMVAATPSTTLAGIAEKARLLRHNVDAGRATDGRDVDLVNSIIADLERMQPAQAYAQAIAAE